MYITTWTEKRIRYSVTMRTIQSWTCELGYGADTMFHRRYFLFTFALSLTIFLNVNFINHETEVTLDIKMMQFICVVHECILWYMRKHGSCTEKEIMQGKMPGACRWGRPRTAWMDNINTWTGLPVEVFVRVTEDRAQPWCGQPSHLGRLKNRTELTNVSQSYKHFVVCDMICWLVSRWCCRYESRWWCSRGTFIWWSWLSKPW